MPPQLSLPGTASIPLHFGCTVCVLYWANYGILLQAVYCTKPITESCCRQCLRPGSPATQKSPPNNIVVAQRAFLCLLLLTNNQSPGPGALKWKTFFDRQLSDPVRSVSFIQPVGNSIKTVSEHLPCVLKPSVYAGLRVFANYSYSTMLLNCFSIYSNVY